jgi:hypothetical protein
MIEITSRTDTTQANPDSAQAPGPWAPLVSFRREMMDPLFEEFGTSR